MARSCIEWTESTWNPVRGCRQVSPGCKHCYAERMAHRFSGPGMAYEGLTRLTKAGPKWTGQVRLVEEVLDEPLRWRQPRRIFVNSMSDLFHEDVPLDFIQRVFNVMLSARRHTFQILTKRAERREELGPHLPEPEHSGRPGLYLQMRIVPAFWLYREGLRQLRAFFPASKAQRPGRSRALICAALKSDCNALH